MEFEHIPAYALNKIFKTYLTNSACYTKFEMRCARRRRGLLSLLCFGKFGVVGLNKVH